ncbi:hypothetical protein N0V82_003683 [Gnomoniopsis sp. IMI 355080]|nr:hypothetical protein N0V82_003683 [Gnomoniopsis sp. IMI 355080]
MNLSLPELDYEKGWEHYKWNGGTVKHIDREPGSEGSIRKIKNMMARCSINHDFCKKAEALVSQIRRLPKRVVEVGPADNTGIRVFEHAYDDEIRKEKYIALSHTWGSTRHTLLKHDNSKQMKRNVPHDELPSLYQDAIAITRRFGYQYIWIDSLCIIQGDDHDFAAEGAKMALIYEGAEFVLAASSAPNGDAGLCVPRGPYVEIKNATKPGETWSVFAREECTHRVLGDEHAVWRAPYALKDCSQLWAVPRDPASEQRTGGEIDYTDFEDPDCNDFPLNYRAWCLQERILGSKVLHFTKQELLFECLTSLECECGFFEDHRGDLLLETRRAVKSGREHFGRVQLESISFSGRVARRTSRWHNQFRKGVERPEPAKIDVQQQQSSLHRETWRDLVVQYSQKKLSDPYDALVAIAGLAQRWENTETTGRYLAGLWEKDILNGLRWMPDTKEPESILANKFHEREQKIGRDIDRYLAPSWSWASIQRGVAWKDAHDLFDLDNYFVTVDHDLHPPVCKQKDVGFEHGKVSYGYIFMTGEIMTVEFWMQQIPPNAPPGGFDIRVHLVKNGVRSPATAIDNVSRLEQQPILPGRISEKGTVMRQLWCLRFCSKPFPAFGGSGGYGSEGALLLVDARPEMKCRQPGFVQQHEFVFERVGFTYGYMTEDWDHALDSKRVSLCLI